MRTGQQTEEPQTIEAYLKALDASLCGPRSWKRRVLETEDGLFSDLEDAGTEREAILRWGPVAVIAAQFNESGLVVRARRMGWQILQWLPMLAIGWALVVQLSPDPWAHEPMLIRVVAPLLFASATAAVIGSVQLVRRGSGKLEPAGVISACTGVGLGVLCIVVLLAYRLDASGWKIFWPAACASATVTVGLVVAVFQNARHLLTFTLN